MTLLSPYVCAKFFDKKCSSWTALTLKMGPIGNPETSVTNYKVRCVKSQKADDLIDTASAARNHALKPILKFNILNCSLGY